MSASACMFQRFTGLQLFVEVDIQSLYGGKQTGVGSVRHTDLLPGFVDGDGSVTTVKADLSVQLGQVRCFAANHAQLSCTAQPAPVLI